MMKEDKRRSKKEPVLSNDIEQFNIVAKYKLNEIIFKMPHVSSTASVLTWRQVNQNYSFPKHLMNVTSKLLPGSKHYSSKYIPGKLKVHLKENKRTDKEKPLSSNYIIELLICQRLIKL